MTFGCSTTDRNRLHETLIFRVIITHSLIHSQYDIPVPRELLFTFRTANDYLLLIAKIERQKCVCGEEIEKLDRRGFAYALFPGTGTEQLIEVSCHDQPTEDVDETYESTRAKSRMLVQRMKREVLRCALTESYYYHHHEHHLSILPYHPVGCPSVQKRTRERERRTGRRKERPGGAGNFVCARVLTTEISPRDTRHHVELDLAPVPPPWRYTMGRPTIERIGVDSRHGAARRSPTLAEYVTDVCRRMLARTFACASCVLMYIIILFNYIGKVIRSVPYMYIKSVRLQQQQC